MRTGMGHIFASDSAQNPSTTRWIVAIGVVSRESAPEGEGGLLAVALNPDFVTTSGISLRVPEGHPENSPAFRMCLAPTATNAPFVATFVATFVDPCTLRLGLRRRLRQREKRRETTLNTYGVSTPGTRSERFESRR